MPKAEGGRGSIRLGMLQSLSHRGGSAWESNPPETVRTAPHQF